MTLLRVVVAILVQEKLLDIMAVRDEFAKTFKASYGSFDASLATTQMKLAYISTAPIEDAV